jgi:hypothetical protein
MCNCLGAAVTFYVEDDFACYRINCYCRTNDLCSSHASIPPLMHARGPLMEHHEWTKLTSPTSHCLTAAAAAVASTEVSSSFSDWHRLLSPSSTASSGRTRFSISEQGLSTDVFNSHTHSLTDAVKYQPSRSFGTNCPADLSPSVGSHPRFV